MEKDFNKIPFTPEYLITQLEENEKPMGEPCLDRATCVKKIILYREKGILTEAQENELKRIYNDYFDDGDIF